MFGGEQNRYQHRSDVLDCDMVYAVYLPPQAAEYRVPVVYYLSGLTCTDENFVTKAGAQCYAAEHGVAVVAPDTSPRGEGVADDPDGSYDMGLGAGFYLNATQAPWSAHYQMYDYIVSELPQVLAENCPQIDTDVRSDHGALNGRTWRPDDWPQKPRALCFALRIFTDRCTHTVPLGQKSVHPLFGVK